MAQRRANKCSWGQGDQGGFANFSPYPDKVGQNIAYDTNSKWSGPAGATEPIDRWYGEVEDYRYNKNSCQKGKMCKNYTQVTA